MAASGATYREALFAALADPSRASEAAKTLIALQLPIPVGASEALGTALHSTDADTRAGALEVARHFKIPVDQALLTLLVKDNAATVRADALYVFAEQEPTPNWTNLLRTALHSSESIEVDAALEALAKDAPRAAELQDDVIARLDDELSGERTLPVIRLLPPAVIEAKALPVLHRVMTHGHGTVPDDVYHFLSQNPSLAVRLKPTSVHDLNTSAGSVKDIGAFLDAASEPSDNLPQVIEAAARAVISTDRAEAFANILFYAPKLVRRLGAVVVHLIQDSPDIRDAQGHWNIAMRLALAGASLDAGQQETVWALRKDRDRQVDVLQIVGADKAFVQKHLDDFTAMLTDAATWSAVSEILLRHDLLAGQAALLHADMRMSDEKLGRWIRVMTPVPSLEKEFGAEVHRALANVATANDAAQWLRDVPGERCREYVPELSRLLLQDESVVFREPVWVALRKTGPLPPDKLVSLLRLTHDDTQRVAEFRAWAWLLADESQESRLLLQWLGSPKSRPALPLIAGSADLLAGLQKLWPFVEKDETLSKELSESINYVVTGCVWHQDDLKLLSTTSAELEKRGFKAVALSLNDVTTKLKIRFWIEGILLTLLGHITFWVVLLGLYPRSPRVQAAIFWSPWLRPYLGLGYVNLLLIHVSFLRRLILSPFASQLLELPSAPGDTQAGVDSSLAHYYPGSYVRESLKKNVPGGEAEAITQAIPELRGAIVVFGESGLGKTMFLRRTAGASKRLVVCLSANECRTGVIDGIAARLPPALKDGDFLSALVYSGGLDVYVDGLNEVSPDTRVRIIQFVEANRSTNVLLTTQPLNDWAPPKRAQTFELLPLKNEQIAEFLTSRAAVVGVDETKADPYRRACRDYVDHVLASENGDEWRRSMQIVLSNPMDLTVVAELLAKGHAPDLRALQQQQYEVMATSFERGTGRPFPLPAFSEVVFDMRNKDLPDFPTASFPEELVSLEAHKLMRRRNAKSGDGKDVTLWYFRHDKVTDFFILQAFLKKGEEDRPTRYLTDARFRGVYFLLAARLPLSLAQALREKLLHAAIEKQDHSVSDQFIQILADRTHGDPDAPAWVERYGLAWEKTIQDNLRAADVAILDDKRKRDGLEESLRLLTGLRRLLYAAREKDFVDALTAALGYLEASVLVSEAPTEGLLLKDSGGRTFAFQSIVQSADPDAQALRAAVDRADAFKQRCEAPAAKIVLVVHRAGAMQPGLFLPIEPATVLEIEQRRACVVTSAQIFALLQQVADGSASVDQVWSEFLGTNGTLHRAGPYTYLGVGTAAA